MKKYSRRPFPNPQNLKKMTFFDPSKPPRTSKNLQKTIKMTFFRPFWPFFDPQLKTRPRFGFPVFGPSSFLDLQNVFFRLEWALSKTDLGTSRSRFGHFFKTNFKPVHENAIFLHDFLIKKSQNRKNDLFPQNCVPI